MSSQSAYQTKIEKKLAEFSIALDPAMLIKIRNAAKNGGLEKTILGEDLFTKGDWNPTRFYYAVNRIDCQLCGHPNLKRVFVIKSNTNGQELHIGSECASNYLDADVVKGLCKIYDLEYNKIVNPIKFEKELELLAWAAGEGEKYTRYYCLAGKRYNLLNCGNVRLLQNKINSGKPIGKREKEVLAFWQDVKDNAEKYDVEEATIKAEKEALLRKYREQNNAETFFRNLGHYIEVWKKAIKSYDHTTRIETEFQQQKQKLLNNARNEYEIKFINNVTDRLAAGLPLSSAQKRWYNDIVNRSNKKVLIDKLVTAGNLSDWEKKFVESVNGFFQKNGFITPKQLKYLNKIESKMENL